MAGFIRAQDSGLQVQGQKVPLVRRAPRGCHGALGEEIGRTKRSSVAVPKVAFLGEAVILASMSMRLSVFLASLLNSASNVDRKGLRDIGLLPELERSWRLAGD